MPNRQVTRRKPRTDGVEDVPNSLRCEEASRGAPLSCPAGESTPGPPEGHDISERYAETPGKDDCCWSRIGS